MSIFIYLRIYIQVLVTGDNLRELGLETHAKDCYLDNLHGNHSNEIINLITNWYALFNIDKFKSLIKINYVIDVKIHCLTNTARPLAKCMDENSFNGTVNILF